MSVSYNIVIFAILSNKPILLNNITRLERGSAGFIWEVAFRGAFFFRFGKLLEVCCFRCYARKLPKNPEVHSMRDV